MILWVLVIVSAYNVAQAGNPSLLAAILSCKEQEVRNLLWEDIVRIDDVDDSGNNALHVVVAEGTKEQAQLLLQLGVSLNKKNINGSTPLDIAFSGNYIGMVLLLSSHKYSEI